MKFILLCIILCLMYVPAVANDKYDKYFRRYSIRYNLDSNIVKAQATAESNLNPNAESPVGAKGMLQIMPNTAEEISRKIGVRKGIFDPEFNIMLGTFYDHKLFMMFKNEKGYERLAFMLGAFNSGPGNIIKAQKIAVVSDKWVYIEQALPSITGKHSAETINYVKRIQVFYKQYTGIPFRLKEK